jgi:hypothetical protein
MTSILYRYLIVIIACVSLLGGLQIPNFVDQYQKRLDAHLREVTANLQPFQDIANKYLEGNLTKLIELNRKSVDRPLQEEGNAIQQMADRKLRFEADIAALQTILPLKALHIFWYGDQEIFDEAIAQYSYNVPLDQDALFFGAGVAFVFLIMAELLLALARIALDKLLPLLKRPPQSN